MTAMATPSKRTPASVKPTTASKVAATEAAQLPFLRFSHSAALRASTLSVLDALEQAGDPTTHREALAGLVLKLTEAGLEYFFMQPLKLSKPGFIVVQSASLGLIGVQQVMGSVTRQVIARMDAPQLISVCGSIRRFML
jgi:hypothetical protein